MTSKQLTVMWMGILLVVLRFFTSNQFSLIWSDIVSGPDPGYLIGKVPDSMVPRAKPPGGTGLGSALGVPLGNNGPTLQA